MVFFFKQKTAYEMRISDWSSDVCSSDLFRVDRFEAYRDDVRYAGRTNIQPVAKGVRHLLAKTHLPVVLRQRAFEAGTHEIDQAAHRHETGDRLQQAVTQRRVEFRLLHEPELPDRPIDHPVGSHDLDLAEDVPAPAARERLAEDPSGRG